MKCLAPRWTQNASPESGRFSSSANLQAKRNPGIRIADELVLANSTVTTHVRGLYRKLDVHNRQELLDFVEARR